MYSVTIISFCDYNFISSDDLLVVEQLLFYGPYGHPYNCFPRGLCIYICLWPLTRVCVVYVVKEVASFWGGSIVSVFSFKVNCVEDDDTPRINWSCTNCKHCAPVHDGNDLSANIRSSPTNSSRASLLLSERFRRRNCHSSSFPSGTNRIPRYFRISL